MTHNHYWQCDLQKIHGKVAVRLGRLFAAARMGAQVQGIAVERGALGGPPVWQLAALQGPQGQQ